MKYLLIPVFCLTILINTFSQTAGDALRYSRTQHFGTARMTGVGGAFAALGADFGSIGLNPAGLAMFRTDEFMFTPGVYFSSTDANVPNGNTSSSDASRFRFTNLGMVFNSNMDSEKSDWKTFNVGIGFNQLSNFGQSIDYDGQGAGTILTGWFKDSEDFLAGGGDPENLYPLGSGMAYKAGAIYFIDGQPSYDFNGNEGAVINRTHFVETRGGQNELSLSFAGNYKEKLMIGASFGVPIINYRQDATYTESDPGGGYEGNVTYFDNLTYSDYLRTTGVGFNAKLGATFRVSQAFRIGGAFHSPTFLNLTDNFNTELTYAYEDLNANGSGNIETYENSAEGDAEPFNYGLRTPWKGVFGGAFLFKKYGFVSADVEWIDYSSSRFNLTRTQNDASTRAIERDLNNTINSNYQQAINYRFGAEAVLDIFRLRAGYNLLGKAKKGDTGFNNAISFGAGIRMKSYYIDLAFRRSSTTGAVSADSGSNTVPTASTESNINDILLTVGFKF